MDITTAFEAVIPGSNPGGSTQSLRRVVPRDRTASVSTGFEDPAVVSSAKPWGCTVPVGEESWQIQ